MSQILVSKNSLQNVVIISAQTTYLVLKTSLHLREYKTPQRVQALAMLIAAL